MSKINKNIIIIAIAVIIHVLFYISAVKFHFFDYFFPWGNVHDQQGIDFFQVPNGAYMFLKGGNLTGISSPNLPTYSYGNYNVYHPLFTILIGTFFTLFAPHNAFIVMMLLKIFITLFTIYFLYKHFYKNKYFTIALFSFLTFFPQYLEIWNGQYHFFLEITLLFLLYFILKQEKETLYSGFLLFLNLLIKPIGLLWIPVFFIKKRWKTLALVILLSFIAIFPFLINQTGNYFINNLIERLKSPIGGPPGVFTLDAIARFYNLSFYNSFVVKSFIMLLLFFLIIRYKISIFWSLFIITSFYLLFYDLVFEYHYTILIPFFVLGILTQKTFQSKTALALILSFSLPTPFFIFHFLQIFTQGHFVTNQGWIFIVLFRTLPLLALTILVLIKEIKVDFSKLTTRQLQ
jgi:hypothetical protein